LYWLNDARIMHVKLSKGHVLFEKRIAGIDTNGHGERWGN